jgi:hypothetical protein
VSGSSFSVALAQRVTHACHRFDRERWSVELAGKVAQCQNAPIDRIFANRCSAPAQSDKFIPGNNRRANLGQRYKDL